MRGADTNLLLRAVTRDDPSESPIARQLLRDEREAGGILFISTVALCETVWTLRGPRYRWSRAEIAELLIDFLESDGFQVQERGAVLAATQRFRSGSADFADFLLGELGRLAGCTDTVTFDQALTGVPGFTVLEART